jgi:protein-tyrosine phosphatase
MSDILFLCTGNYYRSRLAEIYFNHKMANAGSHWRADSRGLRINPGNYGPLSPHTERWLKQQGIPLPQPLRFPIPVQEADFWTAKQIVAVKEAEHKPLMLEHFPHWHSRSTYWNIHDLDAAEPQDAIPVLIRHVDDLIAKLVTQK